MLDKRLAELLDRFLDLGGLIKLIPDDSSPSQPVFQAFLNSHANPRHLHQ